METTTTAPNPAVNKGDRFQVGTMLADGEIMWGTVQTVKYLCGTKPAYRARFGKVDKVASYWRFVPNTKASNTGLSQPTE